ncbi:unnamed protein product, partial [Hapterophycus canaliculatus]
RTIVAKEPRVLALDMGSTVPRKLQDLARAFGEHASYPVTTAGASGDGGDDDDDDRGGDTGTGRVLRYFPNALRFEPATLARKLEALQRAGLSPEMALEVIGGAPRCLSVAEGTLERRVSALREAFPSVPLSRLLGEAPCLLQNRIDPAAKVEVLQELFPSSDPVSLVEGAPMLLALSPRTLRVKSDAWRHILEDRIDVSWEQTVAEFPQLLCQGLGRAARVAFLLLAADDERATSVTAAANEDKLVESTPLPSYFRVGDGDNAGVNAAAGVGGDGGGGGHDGDSSSGSSGTGVGKRMSAAAACGEICRRVSDFESDHPSYPAFLGSLLLAATSRRAA